MINFLKEMEKTGIPINTPEWNEMYLKISREACERANRGK